MARSWSNKATIPVLETLHEWEAPLSIRNIEVLINRESENAPSNETIRKAVHGLLDRGLIIRSPEATTHYEISDIGEEWIETRADLENYERHPFEIIAGDRSHDPIVYIKPDQDISPYLPDDFQIEELDWGRINEQSHALSYAMIHFSTENEDFAQKYKRAFTKDAVSNFGKSWEVTDESVRHFFRERGHL